MDSSRSFDASPGSSARGDAFDYQPQHGGFSTMHRSGGHALGASQSAPASLSTLLSPLPSLTLSVSVRDVTLQVEVGPGTQTAKWLATTCAAQYAATRPEAAAGGAQFLPVHLTELRGGNALFPEDVLCEKLEQGDMLKLELLGPRLGPTTPNFARERTLWELYAWTAAQPHALVPVVLLFDASELALSAPPAIFGNFNAWGTPMHMNYYKDNTYKFQMDFPAGSGLVFKFVVGGASLLTPKVYPIVHDSGGNKLHYLKVAPVPPNSSMDAAYATPGGVSTGGVGVGGLGPSSYPKPALQAAQAAQALDLSTAAQGRRCLTLKEQIALNARALAAWQSEQKLRRNGPELPVLSGRVVGTFPTALAHKVPKANPRDDARRLARDWFELARSIGDVFPPTIPAPAPDAAALVAAARSPKAAAELAAAPKVVPQPSYAQKLSDLRGVLSKYHSELTSLFHYYAQGTPGLASRGPSWNLLSFLSFLSLIKVPDNQRATLSRLDRIYFKVLESRDPSNQPRGDQGDGTLVRGRNPVALGAAELRSGNNSVGKVLLQHENLWSGLNALSRPEFMQALLRVAMLKFPNPHSLAEWIPPVEEKREEESAGSGAHKMMTMTSAAGMAALQAKQEAEAKRLAAQAAPPTPPRVMPHPNPALSLELLLKMHLLPFAASSGVVQAAGATASSASLLNLPTPQSFNPTDLRARLLLDPNVFALLRQYSDQLHALFRHYTGGAEASGLGLGLPSQAAGLPGAAAHAGIPGGANGANPASLPPTLLGANHLQTSAPGALLSSLLPAPGRPYAGAHLPSGALKSSSAAPVASATIHLRELEQLLADYELLDSMLPRPRALQQIGIVLDGGAQGDDAPGGAGGASSSASSGAPALGAFTGEGNGAGGEVTLELLYPEFLELLVRIADTGHQWSDLHVAQQAVIAQAYASGALNPLDKVPPSLLVSAGLAGHGGFGGRALDDDQADGLGGGVDDATSAAVAAAARRRGPDQTELCERFARLLAWIFPNEEQQRERRAKLAAQASASAAPAAAPAAGAPPGTAGAAPATAGKDEKADGKGAKAKSGSASAKGPAPKTPLKSSSAAAKKK